MKKFIISCLLAMFVIIANSFTQSGWTFYKYNDLPVSGMSFCVRADYTGGVFLGSTGGLMKHNSFEWIRIYYNELNPSHHDNKYNIRRITFSQGEVWASTNEGLIKFNGYERKHYNLANTPSMCNDKIRGIASDKYGNIWFVNHCLGIFKLEKTSDTVVYYSIPQSTPLPFVEDIPMFCDAYDNLWYSCEGKFVKFSDGNIKIIDETEIPELKKDTVSSIQIMADNSIIVLMRRSIGNYKEYNGTITYNSIDIPVGLMNDNEYFAMVKMDFEGNCWILSRLYDNVLRKSQNFYKYSKNKEWTKYEFPTFEGTVENKYTLSDFTIDKNGKVWFSDPYYGVFVFDSKTTSVNDINIKKIINLSPNPSSDIITISLSNLELSNTSISIFNSLGREVKRIENKELNGKSTINITTSDLPVGIYYCTFNSGKAKITRRFVVIR